jgi:DNA-binding PadR family transcriptional regulator
VLALVFERPMHPYEMASVMKQRHKHESIKLRYGSLYTVTDLLVQRGFIAAKETIRDGLTLTERRMSGRSNKVSRRGAVRS